MLYAVPIGILLFAIMIIILRLFFKPDMSKISNFNIDSVLNKYPFMTKREKITVITFFSTVVMWILPAVLSMVAPNFILSIVLNKFGITFWAILAVVLLAVVKVDGKSVLDLKTAFTDGVNWNVIFLVAACVLMGAVVTNEAVGLNQFILMVIEPITNKLPPLLLVLFLVALTAFLTNFTSNMTAMVLMLGVGLSLTSIEPFSITLAIIVVSDFAFIVPSSSNLIGMLYGDEYSNGRTIFKYGSILAIIGVFIVALIGYPFSLLLN